MEDEEKEFFDLKVSLSPDPFLLFPRLIQTTRGEGRVSDEGLVCNIYFGISDPPPSSFSGIDSLLKEFVLLQNGALSWADFSVSVVSPNDDRDRCLSAEPRFRALVALAFNFWESQ